MNFKERNLCSFRFDCYLNMPTSICFFFFNWRNMFRNFYLSLNKILILTIFLACQHHPGCRILHIMYPLFNNLLPLKPTNIRRFPDTRAFKISVTTDTYFCPYIISRTIKHFGIYFNVCNFLNFCLRNFSSTKQVMSSTY